MGVRDSVLQFDSKRFAQALTKLVWLCSSCLTGQAQRGSAQQQDEVCQEFLDNQCYKQTLIINQFKDACDLLESKFVNRCKKEWVDLCMTGPSDSSNKVWDKDGLFQPGRRRNTNYQTNSCRPLFGTDTWADGEFIDGDAKSCQNYKCGLQTSSCKERTAPNTPCNC